MLALVRLMGISPFFFTCATRKFVIRRETQLRINVVVIAGADNCDKIHFPQQICWLKELTDFLSCNSVNNYVLRNIKIRLCVAHRSHVAKTKAKH